MTVRPFTSDSFYQYVKERKLMASRCKGCGALYLPPKALCGRCQTTDMEWAALSGRGKLVAFTTIAVGLSEMMKEGFDRHNPYCSGVVELEEGPRISARILGVDAKRPEGIAVGSPARIDFLQDEEGKIRPAVAFRVGAATPTSA